MSAPSSVPARHAFVSNGATVYEWEQSVDDVTMHLSPPAGVRAADLDICLCSRCVRVGLRHGGTGGGPAPPPFLCAAPGGQLSPPGCTWTLADGRLEIVLAKARRGEAWSAALAGHAPLDAAAAAADRRTLLLERFQAEHPGFDFRDAAINGDVPDAREYLGGMPRG